MKNKPLSEVKQIIETFATVECGITYYVTYTGEQTRDDNWECDGWRFTIKGRSFDYFTGTGHREKVRGFAAIKYPGATHVRGHWEVFHPVKPPIAGLLHSLILDSEAAEQTFNSWCSEFGYDTDSRKALATYEACQKDFDKLRKVFNSEQIKHIRELLQDY